MVGVIPSRVVVQDDGFGSATGVKSLTWTQQEMGAQLLLELFFAYLFVLNAWKEKLLQSLHLVLPVLQQCFAPVLFLTQHALAHQIEK